MKPNERTILSNNVIILLMVTRHVLFPEALTTSHGHLLSAPVNIPVIY
jgi:hypothetical protein